MKISNRVSKIGYSIVSAVALSAGSNVSAVEGSNPPASDASKRKHLSLSQTILDLLGNDVADPTSVLDAAKDRQSLEKTEMNPTISVESSFGSGPGSGAR